MSPDPTHLSVPLYTPLPLQYPPKKLSPKSIKNKTKQIHPDPPSFHHLFIHPSGAGWCDVSNVHTHQMFIAMSLVQGLRHSITSCILLKMKTSMVPVTQAAKTRGLL